MAAGLALLLTAIVDSAGKLDNVDILLHLPAWLRLQNKTGTSGCSVWWGHP